jgi:hypothetical protein
MNRRSAFRMGIGVTVAVGITAVFVDAAFAAGAYYGSLQRPSSGTLSSTITAEGCTSNLKSATDKAWTDWNDYACDSGQYGGKVGVRVYYPGGTWSAWVRDYDLAVKTSSSHLTAQFEMNVTH